MRRLVLVLGMLLLAACGPAPDPTPDSPDLTAQQVAGAFARAVLERADPREAARWSTPSASLDLRSQVGFLQGDREVKFTPGRADRGADGAWTATVRIETLRLGNSRYQGHMHLDMGPDGRRVRDSALLLERDDGVGVSL